ncbi:MAG TPA: hypothetical protein VIM53_03450 [Candidatus Saccharimonadales bacterium]
MTDELVVAVSHKKGTSCQTITPPFLSSSFDNSGNSNDSFDDNGLDNSNTYNYNVPTETQ